MFSLHRSYLALIHGTVLLTLWLIVEITATAQLDTGIKIQLNESLFSNLREGETKQIVFFVDYLPTEVPGDVRIQVQEQSPDGITHIRMSQTTFPLNSKEKTIDLTGTFLGFSKVKFSLISGAQDLKITQNQLVSVKVHREEQLLDRIFVYVIIILVLIAFINMGCAVNFEVIKENIRRPVAPAIGLCSQYFFMPVVSYGLGYLLFQSSPELWLGMFLTGCAPGGGGSNMWTYLLGGSLDLSVTMTFLSTVLAFAALPLWVFALGPTIFPEGDYGKLPYHKIASLVLGLVVPIGIGLLIRKFCPRAADVIKKMLNIVSIFFIVFIMTFGVYVKYYIFKFFTWKVAVGGFLVPFLGFSFGTLVAKITGRSADDVIAIAVETGVQNTGLAIGVLKVTLHAFDPMGDISMVVPVAVATMTPIPLSIALIWQKIRTKQMASSKSPSSEELVDRGKRITNDSKRSSTKSNRS